MDALIFAINAIFPIIILFLFGYALKHFKFFDRTFFNQLNKYIFRIALPALLFYKIYEIENVGDINWDLIAFSIIAIFVIFILGLISVLLFVEDDRKKGVILQAVFRSNFGLIGLPLAESIGGAEVGQFVAVLFAFAIPLNNVLAVISLTMFQKDDKGKISIRLMVRNIITNPLILAVIVGIITIAIRGLIPVVDGEIAFSIARDLPIVYKPIYWIGSTATPLALIALGGQFELSVVKSLAKDIIHGTLWRILIVPGLVLTTAYFLRHRFPDITIALPALIALFGTPVAVSSVIMAHEMKGDDQLAGQLVVWTSIGSVFTIFIIMVVFRSLGML